MMLSKRDRMHNVNRTYRHLIEVWDLESTEQNEIGEDVQVPKLYKKLWADVKPLRGKEFTEAQKTASELQYRITTRYRAGIDPSMEVRWNSKKLNITAIIDVSGREESMELMCVERMLPSGRR